MEKNLQTAVIGAGLMGHGIALTLARAGQYVAITDPHEETLSSATARITASLKALGATEGAHQNAPLSRTRPMVSPAPPATASVATPISVFEVATLVVRLLVSSQ